MNTTNNVEKSSDQNEVTSVNLAGISEKMNAVVNSAQLSFEETVARISCILLVTGGRSCHSKAAKVNEMLPVTYKDRLIKSDFALWQITGGGKVLRPRLAKGGVLPTGVLGKWTPDFITGLRRSGVISNFNKPEQGWVTASMKSRDVLRKLLLGEYGQLPFRLNIKYAKAASANHVYLIYGCVAFTLGADDPNGVGVLAGLLAGGRRVDHDNASWICLTEAHGNAEFLDSFAIPYIRVEKLKGTPPNKNGHLLVSPFWGALLSNEMPKELGDYFEGWKRTGKQRIGMYPLLPWVFLRGACGYKCRRDLPRGMVPFLLNRDTYRDEYGLHLANLREDGFRMLGVTRIDTRLRAAWIRRLVAKGFGVKDFPRGKAPVDFEKFLC
jgi:hypothetical protein